MLKVQVQVKISLLSKFNIRHLIQIIINWFFGRTKYQRDENVTFLGTADLKRKYGNQKEGETTLELIKTCISSEDNDDKVNY